MTALDADIITMEAEVVNNNNDAPHADRSTTGSEMSDRNVAVGGSGTTPSLMKKQPSTKSIFLQNKSFSREAFYVQSVLIYIICITCIINLSIGTELSNVWVSLLSGSLGYILPAPHPPSERKNKVVDLLDT